MFEAGIFASPKVVILGALFGFLFGFFLRKGYVTRFNVIAGQLALKDFTVMKVILTAIIVGGAGVYFMLGQGWIALELSKAALPAALVGGVIFGVGMAIMGYCPGTAVAALADGSRDMIFGILGMMSGIAVFAEIYPWVKAHFTLTLTKSPTLVSLTGIPAWGIFLILAGVSVVLFTLIDRVVPPKKG